MKTSNNISNFFFVPSSTVTAMYVVTNDLALSLKADVLSSSFSISMVQGHKLGETFLNVWMFEQNFLKEIFYMYMYLYSHH